MRTFECYTYEAASNVPTLAFIFASDELLARALARREVRDARQPVAIEICENGRLVWSAPVGADRLHA